MIHRQGDMTQVRPPRVLRGHNLEVWRLALLPDSKTLVSGSKDGSVYLWDTTAISHEQARAILPATVAAWRFAPDGKAVVTIDVQGHVARWKGTAFQDREPLMDLGQFAVGPQRVARLAYRAHDVGRQR